MDIPTRDYDRCFDQDELRRVHRLRSLDKKRKIISIVAGVAIYLLVLAASSFLSLGKSGFWIALTLAVAGAWLLNAFVDGHIEQEFIQKWDPLFEQRSPISVAQIAAREELLRLTDSIHFYGLSDEQQRAAINEIYRRHGLGE